MVIDLLVSLMNAFGAKQAGRRGIVTVTRLMGHHRLDHWCHLSLSLLAAVRVGYLSVNCLVDLQSQGLCSLVC